jgi:16S rRNA (cytosine1402-N4)-methyltransferase
MNGPKKYHQPVLLKETRELLQVKKGGRYVDGTIGGGGHTRAILELGGWVLGIDQDPEAIAYVKDCFKEEVSRGQLVLRQGNFANLKEIAQAAKWCPVDGVLLDLGVSSHQLETDYRGFSFNLGGKLDMRMDQMAQIPDAGDLINGLTEKELTELFLKLGEENFARKIARKIVEHRKKRLIETTDDLAKIILEVRRKGRRDRTHPATRVFQALRIAVNDELNSLKAALPQAVEILRPGGRLLVISFHSLEDRIVKQFFNNGQKPITPSREEIEANPRARSGKLRVYEKMAE